MNSIKKFTSVFGLEESCFIQRIVKLVSAEIDRTNESRKDRNSREPRFEYTTTSFGSTDWMATITALTDLSVNHSGTLFFHSCEYWPDSSDSSAVSILHSAYWCRQNNSNLHDNVVEAYRLSISRTITLPVFSDDLFGFNGNFLWKSSGNLIKFVDEELSTTLHEDVSDSKGKEGVMSNTSKVSSHWDYI